MSRGPDAILRRAATALLLAMALATTSCRSDAILGFDERDLGAPLEVHVGDRFRVTLQSIGPGEFRAPPDISGTAVQFLEVATPDVVVPGGVTQPFIFRASSRGTATITFRHTEGNPTVQATVVVR
jgi:hypothetical protein